jgi:hypothetical protein
MSKITDLERFWRNSGRPLGIAGYMTFRKILKFDREITEIEQNPPEDTYL